LAERTSLKFSSAAFASADFEPPQASLLIESPLALLSAMALAIVSPEFVRTPGLFSAEPLGSASVLALASENLPGCISFG
jgi:hypothetical protein